MHHLLFFTFGTAWDATESAHELPTSQFAHLQEEEASGWAPTVSGGTAGLAVAVGLLGGIGTLIGIVVDRRHSQTAGFYRAPMDAGASLSIAWLQGGAPCR